MGKSKLKIELNNEINRLHQKLNEARNKYKEIEKFQFGRSNSTKQNQLIEQSKAINHISSYINKLEEQVSLINLRETFDFQNSPLAVVEHLFQAAQSKDFKKLRHLCDPYVENDGDVRIFRFIEIAPDNVRKEFINEFQNGRIIGEPLIGNEKAIVEIAFGPSSSKLEKVNLVKRMDIWYLSSF
ncbi:hypothetical protein [Maribacter sp. LLG6340-A2]|uniref:hypothetical protein n=1 Tax=Maribacter sp. LLG6340-A2 TaxID=3160834 RepID=UPI00386DB3D7